MTKGLRLKRHRRSWPSQYVLQNRSKTNTAQNSQKIYPRVMPFWDEHPAQAFGPRGKILDVKFQVKDVETENTPVLIEMSFSWRYANRNDRPAVSSDEASLSLLKQLTLFSAIKWIIEIKQNSHQVKFRIPATQRRTAHGVCWRATDTLRLVH